MSANLVSDGAAAPVIAGLAVGIIFVAIVSSLFSSASPIPKNSVKWAIDKTENLTEVKTFLSHYPDATTTVYFVTTCVNDKACNTIMRLPKTVEYSYQSAQKMALLRISIDEGKTAPAALLQLSCQILDTEVADEIHGLKLSDNDISDFLRNHRRCP